MKNDNMTFGGFESVISNLTDNTTVVKMSSDADADDDSKIVDPKEITGKEEDEDEDDFEDGEGGADGKKVEDTLPKTEPKTSKTPAKSDSEDSGFGEIEPEIASYVQEELFNKFGFELDEDTKFESLEDVVEFVKEVIEENSKPEYSSEEVAAIDKFVKDGGKISDYIKTVHGGVDVDNIDLTNESNQKAVIRENLKNKGYSEVRIQKMIDRYEDSGVLAEEAEDALDLVKEYKENTSKKLLEDQEKANKEQKQAQLNYIRSVESTIRDVSEIRGVPITQKEKKELMDYIFKPSADGMTAFQKDYVKSHKNLIESAYFTMKGDGLVKKIQRNSASEAAKSLKMKLAEKGKRAKNQEPGQGAGSDDSIWRLASTMLRQP